MKKAIFLKILKKYLAGNATDEEEQFLENYYSLFDSEPDVVALLNDGEKEKLKEQIRSSIWRNIDLNETEKRKHFNGWIQKVSAVVIIITVVAGMAYFFQQSSGPTTLICSVEKGEEASFVYLPDGTSAVVEPGSELRYPSTFDDLKSRVIHLSGKAYFDVTHDPDKPFIIRTGIIKTTVLGTAFSIRAYPEEKNIIVSVERGKVKVEDPKRFLGIITKNGRLIYNKLNANTVQQNIDSSLFFLKRDLLFNNVTLEEACRRLEKEFNVQIKIPDDDEVRTLNFTTTFLQGETLQQVLRTICNFSGAAYHYNKKEAIVTIEKKSKIE